jgi:holo-[acyl-carrier protein] synthase
VIRGIGVDLVSIPRVAAVWQRHGDRFARRILSSDEWPAFAVARQPERLLAKRFAAKEALAKALGTGLRPPMGFQLVSIGHGALGEPVLSTHGVLAAHLQALGISRLHLSLSDEEDTTVAMVVLESQP